MCECTESMQHITGQRSTSALPYTTDKRPLHSTAEHGSTGYNTDEHMLSEEKAHQKTTWCGTTQQGSAEHTPVSLDHAAKRLPKVMVSTSLSPTSVDCTLSTCKSVPAGAIKMQHFPMQLRSDTMQEGGEADNFDKQPGTDATDWLEHSRKHWSAC